MSELVLDLLKSYARERDIDVRLERRHAEHAWSCRLSNGRQSQASGQSAREAIMCALQQAGVEIPS